MYSEYQGALKPSKPQTPSTPTLFSIYVYLVHAVRIYRIVDPCPINIQLDNFIGKNIDSASSVNFMNSTQDVHLGWRNVMFIWLPLFGVLYLAMINSHLSEKHWHYLLDLLHNIHNLIMEKRQEMWAQSNTKVMR